MDLAELLTAERVSCQLNIQSKKRAIQTLAELLGESLRGEHEQSADTTAEDAGQERPDNGEKKSRLGLLAGRSKQDKDASDDLPSDMDIMDALVARERLGATGIGKGVALPHSRLAGIETPIAALLTLENGVDYEAQDQQPVDIMLGLLVPEDCTDMHLQILAQLARRFNDDTLRDELRRFENNEKMYGYLNTLPSAD